jgi:hypothetical protein
MWAPSTPMEEETEEAEEEDAAAGVMVTSALCCSVVEDGDAAAEAAFCEGASELTCMCAWLLLLLADMAATNRGGDETAQGIGHRFSQKGSRQLHTARCTSRLVTPLCEQREKRCSCTPVSMASSEVKTKHWEGERRKAPASCSTHRVLESKRKSGIAAPCSEEAWEGRREKRHTVPGLTGAREEKLATESKERSELVSRPPTVLSRTVFVC